MTLGELNGKGMVSEQASERFCSPTGKDNAFHNTVTASLPYSHFLLLSFRRPHRSSLINRFPFYPILIYGYKKTCLLGHQVRLGRLHMAHFQEYPPYSVQYVTVPSSLDLLMFMMDYIYKFINTLRNATCWEILLTIFSLYPSYIL